MRVRRHRGGRRWAARAPLAALLAGAGGSGSVESAAGRSGVLATTARRSAGALEVVGLVVGLAVGLATAAPALAVPALAVPALAARAPALAAQRTVAADPAPELVFEAPPELERSARRLEAIDPRRLAGAVRLTGLREPGAPIRVLLVPESAELARRSPPWMAGFATGAAGPVVLFPARASAYPYDSLEELLQHEVAHVLVERAARGQPVPRWLHEGIAMTAGEAWDLEDRGRFALAVARRGEVPLGEVDRMFSGDASQVATAYAIAGGFVNDLLHRHGPAVTAELLDGIAAGRPFSAAFRRATGESLPHAEAAFWRRQTLWNRWVPLVTSSTVLWIAVTMLALWAIRRRRLRDAEVAARWAREERAVAPPPPPASADGGEESPWVH